MKGIANSLGDSSLCCAPFRMTNLYLLDISLLFELIQPLLLHHLFSPFSLFLFLLELFILPSGPVWFALEHTSVIHSCD